MTASYQHQDPIDRLRAADPAAGATVTPPIEPLLQRLKAQAPFPDRRPRWTRAVRIGVATTAAVGAAVVGVVALTGGGGGRLDVVAQARAALAPQGEILHLVTRSGTVTSAGGRFSRGPSAVIDDGQRIGRLSVRREQWSATDPTRYRTVQRILPYHGSSGGTIEEDFADGVARLATSWTKEIRVRHVSSAERATMSRVTHALQGLTSGDDPVQRIRVMLNRGKLKPAGTRDLRGRHLLRLVGEDPGDRVRRMPPSSVEYLVDPKTYIPVQMTTSMHPLPGGHPAVHQKAMFTQRVFFERYERLPLNATTRKLLRIDTKGRKVVPAPAATRKPLPRPAPGR